MSRMLESDWRRRTALMARRAAETTVEVLP